MRNQPIVVEQLLNNSIEEVWGAITERDQMIQWFFQNIPEFKPIVGFKTQFLIENEGRKFTHLWEITEVIPKQKIVYSWQYNEYKGLGTVHFYLFKESDKVKLKVTNFGLETFPQHIPEFSRESCKGGWEYFLNRLKLYLQ